MASRGKHSSSRTRRGGSTLYGLMAGLLIGLAVAAAVALYITKAPVPFVDHATRDAARRPAPDPRQAPDPNSGLYGRGAAAGTPATGPTATRPAPLPDLPGQTSEPNDDLGNLIASLDKRPSTPAAAAPAPAQPAIQASYFLQVGAFRVVEDAETLRARVLMMGLPVEIQRAEVDGALLNRVRVGPYARLDDMNQARTRLGQEKIASTVVRQ